MENNNTAGEGNKVATTKRKSSKMVLVKSLSGVVAGLIEHKIMTKEEEKVIQGVRSRLKDEILKEI